MKTKRTQPDPLTSLRAHTSALQCAIVRRNERIVRLERDVDHKKEVINRLQTELKSLGTTIRDQSTEVARLTTELKKQKDRMYKSLRKEQANVPRNHNGIRLLPNKKEISRIAAIIKKLSDTVSRKKNELADLTAELQANRYRYDMVERVARLYEFLTERVVDEVGRAQSSINAHGVSPHDTVLSTVYTALARIESAAQIATSVTNWDLQFWQRVYENGTIIVATNGDECLRRYIDYNQHMFPYARVACQVINQVVLWPDEEIHHVDLDPMNDDPTNWVVMGYREHWALHCEIERERKGAQNETTCLRGRG